MQRTGGSRETSSPQKTEVIDNELLSPADDEYLRRVDDKARKFDSMSSEEVLEELFECTKQLARRDARIILLKAQVSKLYEQNAEMRIAHDHHSQLLASVKRKKSQYMEAGTDPIGWGDELELKDAELQRTKRQLEIEKVSCQKDRTDVQREATQKIEFYREKWLKASENCKSLATAKKRLEQSLVSAEQKFAKCEKENGTLRTATEEKDKMLEHVSQQLFMVEKRVETLAKEKERIAASQKLGTLTSSTNGDVSAQVAYLQKAIADKEAEIQRWRYMHSKIQQQLTDARLEMQELASRSLLAATVQHSALCPSCGSCASSSFDQPSSASTVLNLTGANEHPHSEKGSTTSAELSNIQSKLRLALFQAKEEKEKADRLEAENLEYKRNVAELTSQVDNLERKGKNAKMQLDNSLRKLKTESEANADLQAQMQQVLEIIKEKEVATKKIVDQLGGVKALQQQNVRLKQEVSSKNDDVVLLESRLMECESQVGFLLQSAEQLVFLIEEMCAQEGLEVRRASHEKPDDSTHDKVYHRLHFVSENLVVIVEYIQSLKVQLTECSKKLRSSESQVLKLSAELESTRHAERSASPTSSPQSPDSDGKTSKKK